MGKRVTVTTLQRCVADGERIVAITAYDAATARIADAAGALVLLVGDSLGMAFLGHDTTIPVRLEDVLYHTRAVVRGSREALVVADMPFMTYQRSVAQAMDNAARLIQDGGAHAVKLEGGVTMAPTIRRLTEAGVAVMGHIGLTPQSVHQLGGFRVQGRSLDAARRVVEDADAVAAAGAFAVVLECIPAPVAAIITERSPIPTIGIGAGAQCSGEIQVVTDVLGLTMGPLPRHAKRYAELAEVMDDAIRRYATDVRSGAFPGEEQSFRMEDEVLAELRRQLDLG
jgi:3-methyl-2-oxobutanoate hydroxymethyltransferase